MFLTRIPVREITAWSDGGEKIHGKYEYRETGQLSANELRDRRLAQCALQSSKETRGMGGIRAPLLYTRDKIRVLAQMIKW